MNSEQENFLKAFAALLGNEGEYVNNPEDPGGETKFGISKRAYPNVDIKNLTPEKAMDIYYQDYWLPCACDRMQYALAFEVFDAAVNHGQAKSIMLLQQALGVADDGKLGPISLTKLGQADLNDLLLRYQAYRLKFFTKLQKWDTFGRGWANRVADNLLRDAVNN